MVDFAMHREETEGIVLALHDYGEADRIVTIFTLTHGKIRGIAANARRSVKRFPGLEPFARLLFRISLREGLTRLWDADLLALHEPLRRDLSRYALAGMAAELTDRLLPDALPNPRYYRLLATFIDYLEGSEPAPSDRRFFESNLLNILGYRLPAETCAACGAPLVGAALYDAREGHFTCAGCGDGLHVSASALHLLRRTLTTGKFGAVTFPACEIVEAGKVLDAAIGTHLQKPLNSLLFLREVAPHLDP